MRISDNLKQFLLTNKIYDINSLRELSLSFIASLPGYTKEIGDEILKLKTTIPPSTPKSKFKNLGFSKNLKEVIFVNKEDGYLFSLKVNNPNAPSEIQLSNRLINIIIKLGYDSHFKDFLLLCDETLMGVRNFGQKCLDEINYIRRALGISLTDIQQSTRQGLNSKNGKNGIIIPNELMDLEAWP